MEAPIGRGLRGEKYGGRDDLRGKGSSRRCLRGKSPRGGTSD